MIVALILELIWLLLDMMKRIMDSGTHKYIGASYPTIRLIHHNLRRCFNHYLIAYLGFIDNHRKSPLDVSPFLFGELLLLCKVLHKCEALSKLRLQLGYIFSNYGYCVCCFGLSGVHH